MQGDIKLRVLDFGFAFSIVGLPGFVRQAMLEKQAAYWVGLRIQAKNDFKFPGNRFRVCV
ncbi:hypothetical protein UNDKW_0456 [Undibacterium sp. KW1]|nr:hypothetical protein UNDKW_0456 [Undibacterium sp. KW1]